MSNLLIVGMQWGDEGKGKIVDLLCPAFDAAVRYQGGHNAGHTVKFADRHFSLHLIPSGIVHGGKQAVLGNGMVIAPEAFLKELDGLRQQGIDVEGRLFVSDRAHAVLPYAVDLDQAREAARGDDKIGTTARGIGPAYESKTSRFGFRLGDLGTAAMEARLGAQLARVQAELQSLGAAPALSQAELVERCGRWAEELAPYVCDTVQLLHGWLREGRSLLLEGAQGTLLDIDHGTYPFVTSSNSTAGGACTGTGLPPRAIDGALGVLKAYTTRVGEGPFVTQAEAEAAERLRARGNEFGTTTGRPRRCGWLDLPAVRYACQVNGLDAIALTKLDVLDDLAEIPVCVGYRLPDGRRVDDYTRAVESTAGGTVEPIYETLPGWQQDTVGVLDFDALPQRAREYVRFVEEQAGAPVALISSGPRREETVVRELPIVEQMLGDGVEVVRRQLR